jgi:hypothetical protein
MIDTEEEPAASEENTTTTPAGRPLEGNEWLTGGTKF